MVHCKQRRAAVFGCPRKGDIKMELGINTDYSSETDVIEEIEDSIRLIAEAGFTHVHWCYEWDGDYLYSISEMEQIRGWMDKYGLRAKSLHASKGSRRREVGEIKYHYRKDYTSDIEANRIAGVEQIRNRVELAHVLGTTEIVLHMYLPYLNFVRSEGAKERFYAQVCKSLDELQPFCREKKVRICVENLYEAPGEMQIEQFERLFDRYPAEFLGLCLDTGHANLVWGNRFITEFAERFGHRLFSIHIHDNFGWGEKAGCGDAHRIPGEGGIDWKRLMETLHRSAYEAPWVLEVSKPKGEEDLAFLRRVREAGEKILL